MHSRRLKISGDSRFWTSVEPAPGHGPDQLRAHPHVFELPRQSLVVLGATEILTRTLGFGRAVEDDRNTLGDGEPIPLMSYGLVEYLMGLDLSDLSVLEIGGGQSTLFWCKRAARVHTLEHNAEWLGYVRGDPRPNLTLTEVTQDAYPSALAALSGSYDLIVVDSSANRYECARAAAPLLRPGGAIILDNSDWYPNTAAFLRGLDLIQVDYADFRGDRHYRCCSSIFLHRDFRPRPLGPTLPAPSLGGKNAAADNLWDKPET